MKKIICMIMTVMLVLSITVIGASAANVGCNSDIKNALVEIVKKYKPELSDVITKITTAKNALTCIGGDCGTGNACTASGCNIPCTGASCGSTCNGSGTCNSTGGGSCNSNICIGTGCNTGSGSQAGEIVTNLSDYEKEVVRLTNEQRVKNGLAELSVNTALSDVARTKSQDMHDKGYFSHTSPTYGSPFDMMKAFGITYSSAGENIAMGYKTPQDVVNGWMNSEGHRANILNSSFTQIGVGYVVDGNYYTQMFIG